MRTQFTSALLALLLLVSPMAAQNAPPELVLQTDGFEFRGEMVHADTSALSPDGVWRAAPDADGTAIWHLPSGEKRRVLSCFGAPAWSGDGQFLAVAGRDIQIWKMPAASLFRIEKRGGWRVAFAARSRRFVAFSGQTGGYARVLVFDLNAPGFARTLEGQVGQRGYWDGPQISPDGSRVVVWDDDWDNKERVAAQVFDVETGKVRATLKAKNGVRSARFSPDGKTLAVGNTHHFLTLWDFESGQERKLLGGSPDGSITGRQNFAWSIDGSQIVALDSRGKLRVWETATGRELDALPAEFEGASVFDWNHFSRGGEILNRLGERVFSIRPAPSKVSHFAWNGQTLAHNGAGRLWTWDLQAGKWVCAPEILGDVVTMRLQSGALDAVLSRREGYSFVRSEVWRFGLPSGLLQNALSLSPARFGGDEDGRRFIPLAVSPSGALGIFQNSYQQGGWQVRDLRSGRTVRTFPASQNAHSLVFLGENAVLTRAWSGESGVGSLVETVRHHDLETGASRQISRSRQPTPDWRESLVASPRGTFVALYSGDGAQLWRASTWKKWPLPPKNWRSLAFSRDEKWLASRDADSEISLRALDLQKSALGAPISVGNHAPIPYGGRDALAFSPDGRFLVSGGRDGFRAWNLALARCLARTQTNCARCTCVSGE